MAQLVTKEALDQMATLQKGYIDAKFQAAAPKFTVGYGLSRGWGTQCYTGYLNLQNCH